MGMTGCVCVQKGWAKSVKRFPMQEGTPIPLPPVDRRACALAPTHTPSFCPEGDTPETGASFAGHWAMCVLMIGQDSRSELGL